MRTRPGGARGTSPAPAPAAAARAAPAAAATARAAGAAADGAVAGEAAAAAGATVPAARSPPAFSSPAATAAATAGAAAAAVPGADALVLLLAEPSLVVPLAAQGLVHRHLRLAAPAPRGQLLRRWLLPLVRLVTVVHRQGCLAAVAEPRLLQQEVFLLMIMLLLLPLILAIGLRRQQLLQLRLGAEAAIGLG